MKKALLIGINNYPDGNELTGCLEDVKQVRNAIEKNGDGSPNFSVKTLEDVQTSSEVMDNIIQLFEGDAESALLYFSGHGFVNSTGAEIVMPQNIIEYGQYYTGIQMSNIMTLVNKSKVRNKIIILDCCHSGNMGKYNVEETGSMLNTGVSILTACREDECSMEVGGHGIFTELLCAALNGGASDYCGNITVGGVYAYIDRAFGAWDQRPIFKTNVTEFAPIRKVEPQVSLSVIREIKNLFKNPKKVLSLDPSFERTNDPKEQHEIVEPYANIDNVRKFELLQKLQSIGFVKPVNEDHMYYAAMHSTGCKLTEIGKYYWRLVNEGRI